LARIPVGADGQMLMADSNDTEGLSWVDPPTNRNVVINGAMQVAQRGTSVTSITTLGLYTADRFITVNQSGGTWTQSVENDGPTGSGFRKSLKMLCTTAKSPMDTSTATQIRQAIEGQELQQFFKGSSSAKQFALSFWVKSNVTGAYILEFNDVDNTRQVSASYTISASATWEKKTIIFPADTTGQFDNDTDQSFTFRFWLAAGSDFTSGTLNTTWGSQITANRAVGQTNLAAATNNYWQVTGVQLEPGPVATPFEFEPYETTFAKCQRYYYRAIVNDVGDHFGSGFNKTTTIGMFFTPFPVTMRVAPTALEQTGTAANYSIAHANTSTAASAVPTFESATVNGASTNVTVASGLTAGQGSMARAANTAAYLGWSVEF
jgi:hypothetical protein